MQQSLCFYRVVIPIKLQCYRVIMMRSSQALKYPVPIKEQDLSSQDQEIVVKNLDTGQTHSGTQLTKKLSSISIGNNAWQHYFNSRKKLDQKLLQLVTKKDHANLQALLKEFTIDLNTLRYLRGWTLLHFAINNNDVVAADLLLRFGLDANSITEEMHRTGLHEAALGNKVQVIQLLVGWGADPNVCDSDRNTAMHFAVDYGYFEVVKALLVSSTLVDLSIRNNANMTPFNTCRNSQIFQILVMYDEKVSKRNSVYSKKTADTMPKHSNHRNTYESRLIARNSDVIHNISRVDQVQKFLSLRETPIQKKPSHNSNESVISEQSYEESLVQDAPQPLQPLNTSKNKRKIKRIGSQLRSKITKSSFRIASQNIGLMRQSIFRTHLQNEEVIDNYIIIKKLGSGAFGKVYLVRKKRSTQIYALKELQKRRIAEEGLRRYVDAERFVLTQIYHPFLLHATYCLQDFNNLYILTEYCPGGDLQKIVRDQPLTENIAKTYVCEAALALEQLHKNKVLYRDLKASNTLLDSEGHIRLADFGLAKNAMTSCSFLGSVNYVAPEMLAQGQSKNHGQALDWYLLGVLAYEMLHGLPPFYSQDREQSEKKIREGKPELKQNLSPECKQFLLALLDKDPSKRMVGLQNLKKSSWLKQVNWTMIQERKGEVLPLDLPSLKAQLKKEYYEQQFDDQLIDDKIEWYDNWNYPSKQ